MDRVSTYSTHTHTHTHNLFSKDCCGSDYTCDWWVR